MFLYNSNHNPMFNKLLILLLIIINNKQIFHHTIQSVNNKLCLLSNKTGICLIVLRLWMWLPTIPHLICHAGMTSFSLFTLSYRKLWVSLSSCVLRSTDSFMWYAALILHEKQLKKMWLASFMSIRGNMRQSSTSLGW